MTDSAYQEVNDIDQSIFKLKRNLLILEKQKRYLKSKLQDFCNDKFLLKNNHATLLDYITKLKNELDKSILGPEYEEYRKKVDFTKNGVYQEKGNFSRFYQLIQPINPTNIDTFLFIYKNLSGKDLEFKSVHIKDSFITENESDFYKNVLSEVVKSSRLIEMNYQILCSIRLIDFFECNNTNVSDYLKHSLMNKHIDFALLNLKTFQIDLLIELDDNSHFSEESLTRDFYKDLVITKKGYTLYRTDNGVLLEDNIKAIIDVLTNPKLQGQVIYNYSEEYKEKRSEKLHEYVVGLDECVTNA